MNGRARRLGDRLRDERGLTSVEVAVLFPVMMLIVMMVVQVAFYWHAFNAASLAVEEAVDAGSDGSVTAGAGEAAAQAAALQVLGQASGTFDGVPTVTPNREGAGPGVQFITVTIRGKATSIVPFMNWDVFAEASGPVEEFIPANERS